MPYCLKCDMEFVEGITVCSDCGQPLMDTEEARRIKEEEKQRKESEALHRQQSILAPYIESPEEGEGTQSIPSETSVIKEAQKASTKAYVPKRRRYEDMKSSISAFLLIGGVFLVFSVLCLTGIISLPLAGSSSLIFNIVLTALAVGCLIVAFTTRKSASDMLKEADLEEARTKELITWFLESTDGKALDAVLLREDPNLDENELYLRRFELIQDRLVTAHDLPDPGYVDYLSEELYGKLFEK